MAGVRELNKYLKELSKEELIKEVGKLYDRFKLVKEYYNLELGKDDGKLLEKYKKQMNKLFAPKGNYINPDIKTCNSLVREFASVSVYPTDIVELMLYKVELCVYFLENWGIEFDNVTNAIANTYPEVLDGIYKNSLEKK
ncbi:MAG TPA: DUF6155 family protein, partial [Segetibacter sp.]